MIVSNFLSEATPFYRSKIDTGYKLYKINETEVYNYNINSILGQIDELPENIKLTFQASSNNDVAVNIQKLLCLRDAPDSDIITMINNSMCSVIYVSNNEMDIESNDNKEVLYCFPRPYSKNFLYNTRGAFVTLNHLAPKSLGTSAPLSSTVLHNNVLVNVVYMCHNKDLFLIAVPNRVVTLFAAKNLIRDVVRVIELLYGNLKVCFTKSNNVNYCDCLFARLFVLLLNKKSISVDNLETETYLFEDMLSAAHALMLPMEAKIQIDDALTELEAADYREWVSITSQFIKLSIIVIKLLYKTHFVSNLSD